MPKVKANREVCNVHIVDYATGKPILYFEYANTTGINMTSDSVYAMAHGAKKIAFNNPLENQITIEAQCVPFKLYSLYSDGIIDTSASYYVKKTVKGEAGKLTLADEKGTIVPGSVFVYKAGEYGEKNIAGTFADGVFTPATTGDITVDGSYDVGYMLNRTSGVQKIAMNNKRVPKDVAIYMDTVNKDEDGNLVPFRINVLKATIQRNFEMSFSSEGDPQSITLTFDALEKDRDNFMEFVEITEDGE